MMRLLRNGAIHRDLAKHLAKTPARYFCNDTRLNILKTLSDEVLRRRLGLVTASRTAQLPRKRSQGQRGVSRVEVTHLL